MSRRLDGGDHRRRLDGAGEQEAEVAALPAGAGVSEYLRLGFATLVVLAPGWLVARALGQRGAAPTLAWGLAAVFVAWAVTFAVHGSSSLALGVLLAIGLAALVPAARRFHLGRPGWGSAVLAGGIVLGMLLWRVAGVVGGDGLFHLARVRKLVELGDLHLRTVGEFADGGLHPGYAFPLWHGFLALVAKVSGLDPTVVMSHEASLLVPIACLVAWEAGVAVFGSPAAGFGVLAASLGLYCFAAGHGGSYATLALPGTASRQLLVPAAFALFFLYAESRRLPDLGAIAAVFGALALIHPTYALFALLPLGGYALVRLNEWRTSGLALVAACVPTLLVFAWLLPVVRETASHDPDPAEKLRALNHYAGLLVVHSPDSYRLVAGAVGRSGAVAVAALALVPIAGLAVRRRRWAAFVLGGTIVVLALMLLPELFARFSDAVSLSQSRRAAGFVPFAFAFAGGLALLMRSAYLVPLALVAGIVLQREWPGDFDYGLRHGGPGIVTWWALAGGAAALALGLVLKLPPIRERHWHGAAAAVLFVLPIAVHGFRHWTPRLPSDPQALSPELVRELRDVPPRAVIIAPLQTSYRILAAAPVYVVAAPPTHVADTKANRPYGRAKDVERWLATGDPAIPRAYGATWAVGNGRLYRLPS